jgi:uncharacterized protein
MMKTSREPLEAIESEYIDLIYSCDMKAMKVALEVNPGAIKVRTEWGATVLHRAAQFGCRSLVSLFLDLGIPVNERDFHRQTPLHSSCESRSDAVGVAKELVERGAIIDARDKRWRTPLMHASASSNLRHVKFLLERGANTTIRDRARWSALDHAYFQMDGSNVGAAQMRRLKEIEELLVRAAG